MYAYAEVSGGDITLKGTVVENPDTSALTFLWEQDSNNPSPVSITNPHDSSAAFTLPSGSPYGEYYFNLYTFSSKGDTVKDRTFITVNQSGIKPFDIKKDHAAWIDSAVIYEITPYNFVDHGKFKDIINKIPELASLGINTIWLQPIYPSYGGGQGYDVINYFQVRREYGTETDLKNLISTAKSFGIRIMLDFVANHSSIHHPYAVDASKYGTASHYYDFYQRAGQDLQARYAADYHQYNGFINYFWNELPNLNYHNHEVRKWITEACKYWIEKYNIDGYRFDAVWGVNARDSNFTKELRLSLKRIKPEILMLAEDKASIPSVFNKRFDAAYDWYPEESWVSHWVWQYDYDPNSNPTIFNNSDQNIRTELLRNSLTNNGDGYVSNAIILRFLENNDTWHFIQHHGLERTKMTAALELSLNGIPLIYNGQEAGISGQHPYDTQVLFFASYTIQSRDKYGLFPYYKRLIKLRKTFSSLFSRNFEEVSVTPSNFVYAYRRWEGDQNIFCVINMGSDSIQAKLDLPLDSLNLDPNKTYYLTDMINGDIITGKSSDLASVDVSLKRYTTKLFLLADTAMIVTGINENPKMQVPAELELSQNYPNPFNPITIINFSLPNSGIVELKVFDILGREISTLVSGLKSAGKYAVAFNGSNLPSSVYFYRLEYEGKFITHKMLLLK